MIRELEDATSRGDTLCARDNIVTALRRREETQKEERTEVTADLLAVAEDEQFSGQIRIVPMADDRPAYQLERLAAVGELIRRTVEKRAQAPRHQLTVDWRAEVDRFLNAERVRRNLSSAMEPVEIESEECARQEKAAALGEIAASRFSVLIGPAGTGKTTLLSVLCQHAEILAGKILLLAPTGKARVRMEAVAKQAGTSNYEAATLAQFLSSSARYDSSTQRYRLIGKPGEKGALNVIVDECSMLTEEMMAALN